MCLASILRIKTALQVTHLVNKDSKEFPEALNVDDVFFKQVADLEGLLRPLTLASFRMQKDDANLVDVLHELISFMKAFEENGCEQLVDDWKDDGRRLNMVIY